MKPTEEEMREYAEWVQTRPPNVVAVMDVLPPACYVQAKDGHNLICPAPGKIGLLTTYNEDLSGRVTVTVASDGGLLEGECDPEWLVPVASSEEFKFYQEAKKVAVG